MKHKDKMKRATELLEEIAELQRAIKQNWQSPYNEIRRQAVKEKVKEYNQLINETNGEKDANQVLHSVQDTAEEV